MCKSILPVYTYHVQAWCHGSPGTGLKSCELSMWVLKPEPSRGATSALNGINVLVKRKHIRYKLRYMNPPF